MHKNWFRRGGRVKSTSSAEGGSSVCSDRASAASGPIKIVDEKRILSLNEAAEASLEVTPKQNWKDSKQILMKLTGGRGDVADLPKPGLTVGGGGGVVAGGALQQTFRI